MWGQPFWAAAALSGGVGLDHAKLPGNPALINDAAARKGGRRAEGLTPYGGKPQTVLKVAPGSRGPIKIGRRLKPG